MTQPILVLGGTGKTGRRVASRLRSRGHDVRAASRTGETRFDWDDEATWSPALQGVEAVYLVDSLGSDAADRLASLVALAVAGGARRLVLLSARDWGISNDADLLEGERAVQDSGVAWTILRPAWFSQNFSEEPFLRDPVLEGKVRLPTGAGQEPFIDAGDIADVAVAALTGDGHAEQTYELSGPRLLSFADAVEEIAAATGRDIAFVPGSKGDYAADLAQRGTPQHLVEAISMLFESIRQGRNAHLSDGVQRVLGREPRDFSDYVRTTTADGPWPHTHQTRNAS